MQSSVNVCQKVRLKTRQRVKYLRLLLLLCTRSHILMWGTKQLIRITIIWTVSPFHATSHSPCPLLPLSTCPVCDLPSTEGLVISQVYKQQHDKRRKFDKVHSRIVDHDWSSTDRTYDWLSLGQYWMNKILIKHGTILAVYKFLQRSCVLAPDASA